MTAAATAQARLEAARKSLESYQAQVKVRGWIGLPQSVLAHLSRLQQRVAQRSAEVKLEQARERAAQGGCDVNYLDYDAIPAVNISTLLELLISPKQYKFRLANPREDKACYRLGRAVHTALFEPLDFTESYIVSPFKDFRTDKAKDWRDARAAEGKTVLTQVQRDAARAMARAVNSHTTAMRYLSGGESERAITWTCPRTGILCKGRLDYIGLALSDLKSSGFVTPREFGKSAAKLHYNTKMSWYRDGLRIATGRNLPVIIVCVQNEGPWDVVVYRMAESDLDAGRNVHEGLMDELRMCRELGEFPGIADEELDLKLPAWVDQTEEEETITIGGKPAVF